MTDTLNRCRQAFEGAYDAKYDKKTFATFNGTCYRGPSELNTDWIGFQKGWRARADLLSEISEDTLHAAMTDALTQSFYYRAIEDVPMDQLQKFLRRFVSAFQPLPKRESGAVSSIDYQQRKGAPLDFYTSVAANAYAAAATRDDVSHFDAMKTALNAVEEAKSNSIEGDKT